MSMEPDRSRAPRRYATREFWLRENLQYATPNFRLRKCARLINRVTKGKRCDLLDVGCGPASLRALLEPHLDYHGIDIAIHEPAPYLLEADFVEHPICFFHKSFDFIVALGVFEYLGSHEKQKLGEIDGLLNHHGRFLMSYINFGHFQRKIWPAYNNIHSIEEMTESVGQQFDIQRRFPVSHHWRHKQPGRYALAALQMHLNCEIPPISSWLAVEYLFLCSKRET